MARFLAYSDTISYDIMGRKTTGSGQKKMMANSSRRKGKTKDGRCYLSSKAPPSTPSGLPIYRVDNGSLVCRQCEEGTAYHKGHHPTCPRSRQYDGFAPTPGSPKKAGAPFTAAEKCTFIGKRRHADVIRFVQGIQYQAKKRAARSSQLQPTAKVSLPAGFKFQPPANWAFYTYPQRVDYWKMKLAEAQAKANAAVAATAAARSSIPAPPGKYFLCMSVLTTLHV